MVQGQGIRPEGYTAGNNSNEHHIFSLKTGSFRVSFCFQSIRYRSTFPTIEEAIEYRDLIIEELAVPEAVRIANFKKYHTDYWIKNKEWIKDTTRPRRVYRKKIRPPAPPPPPKRLPKIAAPKKEPKPKRQMEHLNIFSTVYPTDNRWSDRQPLNKGPVLLTWA